MDSQKAPSNTLGKVIIIIKIIMLIKTYQDPFPHNVTIHRTLPVY